MSKKACLDETMGLKKPGAYYLTDIDVTYPIANAYGQELAAILTDEQRARHRARLDETRELKGRFSDYATEDIDVSSPCERLPDAYQEHLDSLEWTESERAWWRHLDAAMQSGQKPF
jgi:hypothetical protein